MPGRATNLDFSRARAIALAVGAGGCLDIFSRLFFLSYIISLLSPSLCETARYRLKFCLKGPLSPTQPTKKINQYVLFNSSCRQDQDLLGTDFDQTTTSFLNKLYYATFYAFKFYASNDVIFECTVLICPNSAPCATVSKQKNMYNIYFRKIDVLVACC